MDNHHFIHTDLQLLHDEELLSYLQNYANDEKLFHEDFAKAYQKLTLVGQKISNMRELDDRIN